LENQNTKKVFSALYKENQEIKLHYVGEDCFKNIGISNVVVHLVDAENPKLNIIKIKGE